MLERKAVVLAVSDVDRAKAFYAGLGWRMDVDIVSGDDRRADVGASHFSDPDGNVWLLKQGVNPPAAG